ncbi:primosomal protein N' [Rothia sp. (in: high G+C Gram-positive bacteria)]|uniref:primosomal protein N' family DNA-binding protein n=1 Tax=Rothia sp. (in: high G+C Gram-positive bacteria) TaxID=1885016 RepID=UPI001CB431D8|nr:primosomal protein N' [Rothia sp. (in: high G+C Gram-positive bacteria)]MBF1655283.1 primosomal protein N' [Rothia sp. (in: high G+C Gram-positive bacteria)]
MTQSSSESNSSAPLGAQQESLQQLDLLQGFPALRDALIPAAPEPVNVAAELEASGVPNPVARVRVDSTLPQVDRTFDYRVPAELSEDAVPGARVRVLFNGHEMTGYIEERTATTDWTRTSLLPLKSVLSRVPSVAPEIFALAEALADRYASTVANVLRLAVPPRIASLDKKYAPLLPGYESAYLGDSAPVSTSDAPENAAPEHAESEPSTAAAASSAAVSSATDPYAWLATPGAPAPFVLDPPALNPDAPDAASVFSDYENGAEFIEDVAAGAATRAVMTVLPGHLEHTWADVLATALAAAATSGRGAIAVVPTAKNLDLLEAALAERLPADAFVRLSSDSTPHTRYHGFVKARLGRVPVVIGTRAAAYAPVANLGLVVCWDDGDSSLVEQRAPYCHARDVLLLRASAENTAALFAGFSMSSEAARLVRTRWASHVRAPRALVRDYSPRIFSTGSEFELARDPLAAMARIPHLAFEHARRALARGPVLVQVARSGYIPSFSCERCRMPARCGECSGPLSVASGSSVPSCSWCGHLAQQWRCSECGFTHWRYSAAGATRTAEELGRAFPNVPVISSAGDHVRASVGSEPALVVATPGAEPVAFGGYAAALLLDADKMLRFDSLRAPEAALRRWLNAAALVRPAALEGTVVTTASPSPVEQALVRWDPAWFARQELEERAQTGLPPAVRTAAVTGAEADVRAFMEEFLGSSALPERVREQLRIVGPVPLDQGYFAWSESLEEDSEEAPVQGDWRTLMFFSYGIAQQVTRELRATRATIAALKKNVGERPVQIRCDGLDVL